jgi:hypothetical protein
MANESPESASLVYAVKTRLDEATKSNEPLELIISVRGTVGPAGGKHRGRWRVRTRQGHVFTFRPEFVVAITGAENGRRDRASSQPATAPAPA